MALQHVAKKPATDLDLPSLVRALDETLGKGLVAVIAGVDDARDIGAWITGEQSPQPDAECRLRDAFEITRLLLQRESAETVGAWFMGMNPDLDDQAPALLLGADPHEVLLAARNFLATRIRRATGGNPPPSSGIVPPHWYQERALSRPRIAPGQRWLDLRAPETRETLRVELAIARWAYEHESVGVAYHSRLDHRMTLWAIFEAAAFEPVGVPEPISPDDPDLRATARLFGLSPLPAPRTGS